MPTPPEPPNCGTQAAAARSSFFRDNYIRLGEWSRRWGLSNGPTNKDKAWALVRIALGIAQVMAATTTLVFLGTSGLTIVATIITLLLVVVSRMVFRREKQA
jgi:uncharacterized membrane protein YbaN (DUF454 family)